MFWLNCPRGCKLALLNQLLASMWSFFRNSKADPWYLLVPDFSVTFTTPRQVLQFLYLHEWMHYYLRERLGCRAQAETICDRFALWNYRRRTVMEEDAQLALRRR